MDPQIDTAQQRAEAIKLANELMLPWQEEPKDLEIIRAALQQTRRDALAEAANIAFDHACEDPQWCNCNSVIYKELDRLREGVK